jgi:signal peptidase I
MKQSAAEASRRPQEEHAALRGAGPPLTTTLLARHLLIQTLRSGRRVAVTLTGTSLEPLLRAGDVVLLEAVDPRSLRPGEITVFDGGKGFVAHRLLRTRRSARHVWIQTAGERAAMPDRWIRETKVIGRAVAIRPQGAAGEERPAPGRWGRRLWAWRTRIRCLRHRTREFLCR